MHPIVFELWDSFCQNTEGSLDENGSNEMDTLMSFADDAIHVGESPSPDSEIDQEQEELLLAVQARAEKRFKQLKNSVSELSSNRKLRTA